MSFDDQTYLDGNAAAGVLSEIFAVDITAAAAQCDGCGRRGVFAEARVYTQAPGLVVRCPGCDGVLMRVVTTPDRTWLDIRGMTHVAFRRIEDAR
jgi:hypothetical protein